jgi:HTH-type transcriptional regulator/antitoxin HipB
LELIGQAIKPRRKGHSLTREELAKMIGFQKAQIFRLENSAGNVPMENLHRVFIALEAKVKYQVEMGKLSYQIEK